MQPPSPRTINLSVALLCLLWGSTWLVIAEGLKDLPPFTSAGIRFALAGMLMALLAVTLGRREVGQPPPARVWVPLGILNFAVSYGIVYWAEITLDSGLTAVLWGVFPMMMAAMGHFFIPGEQLRGAQWLGFVGGFAGVVLLFLTDLHRFGDVGIQSAAILLLSPLACAIGTTLVKREGRKTRSISLNRNGMLLGAALLLILAACTERDVTITWTGTAIFSILYLAIAGTVTTFGLYFWLLRYAEANRLSLIAYVTTVIALFLGWTLGKEHLTWNTVLGTTLIIGGVAAVVRGGPRVRTSSPG